MSISTRYCPDTKTLYCTVEGTLAIDDLKQMMGKILTSDEYSADVKALWDLRKMEFSGIDSDFTERIIELREQNKRRGNAKIAIIADKDLAFGLSRMYQMQSDWLPQTIMVFRDYAEGERWLLGD